MKNFISVLTVVVVLSVQGVILAEPNGFIKSSERLSFNKEITFDVIYIFNSPKRMERGGYFTYGSILAVAGLMYAEKDDIREWIQDKKTSSTDEISRKSRPLGYAGVAPALAATFYLSGLLSDSSGTKETGVMLMESFCYTSLLTLAGRYILAEERPYKGGQMHFFKSGGHGVSGHAALASCLAGPLNRQYLQIKEIDNNVAKLIKYSGKAVLYGYPVLTGFSRLNDDKHYSWNVLLGLGIGYTIGELVADAHAESKKKDVSMMPFIDDKRKGIMVSIAF